MRLKVSDPDLFLANVSRSDRLLEGLLVLYNLHKSSDQLQYGTVGASWECVRQILKVSDPDLFLTYFSRSNKSLEGLLLRYQLHKTSDQLQKGIVGAS